MVSGVTTDPSGARSRVNLRVRCGMMRDVPVWGRVGQIVSDVPLRDVPSVNVRELTVIAFWRQVEGETRDPAVWALLLSRRLRLWISDAMLGSTAVLLHSDHNSRSGGGWRRSVCISGSAGVLLLPPFERIE